MLWGFRVDTNLNSGLGHVSRMLSIAEVFDNKQDIVFIVNNLNDKHCSHIRDHHYSLIDIQSLNSKLDVCLIDGYFFRKDEIIFLRNRSNKIIKIDDHGYRYKYADRTVNFFCDGAENAVVSKKFFQNNFFKIKRNVSNILITFGMADNANATILTLEALRIIEKEIKANIYISLPAKNKYYNKIKNSMFHKKNIKEVKEYRQEEFKNLLRDIDFSIGSGGITLNEILSMGVPAIVISTAENQNQKICNFFKKGLINYCGSSKRITKYKLANSILKFYFSFIERRRVSRNVNLIFSKKIKKDFVSENIINIYAK